MVVFKLSFFSTTILPSDDDEVKGPLPLQRRVPSAKIVMEIVMGYAALKPFLSLAAGSIREGDLDSFTGDAPRD